MTDIELFLRRMLTPGTVPCALFGALMGLLIAVLFLTIGVGKTLLVALCCLIGAFIGGVKDKREFMSSIAWRLRRRNDHISI